MTVRPVILDTDWYTDVDDVMAVRVLVNMQRKGIFRILGLGINARFPLSGRSLDAYLKAQGVDVPVGIIPSWGDEPSGKNGPSYQRFLVGFPSKYSTEEELEPAYKLYRRLLANTEERVDMIGIGFEGNFAALLQSGPDEYSPLSGRELIAQQVGRLWLMAGRWPEGQEYNLAGCGGEYKPIPEAAACVVNHWPTPITFLGFEIGYTVLSGGKLPQDDILRKAMDAYDTTPGYRLCGERPEFNAEGIQKRAHSSWDPLTVILAGIGAKEAGYDVVTGRASVDASSGKNTFVEEPNGTHEYVVKIHPDEYYGNQVDEWLPLL